MSLYADYLKGQGVRHIIETEEGFITWCIIGLECFILEAYVVPEKRKSGLIKAWIKIIEDMARLTNCKYLTCSVIPQSINPELSKKTIQALGFKFYREEPTVVYYLKEL